ncbi:hypothetical protein IJT10_07495, partial [bacterium]|nr:hypothetical protein [bacterium]
MYTLNDLKIFLSPILPASSFNISPWLKKASQILDRFVIQPCVIRSSRKNIIVPEVRRWSEDKYFTIQNSNEISSLFLGEDANLYTKKLNDQRILHPGTDGELIDDIYIYQIIEDPQKQQLELVRIQVIKKLYLLGYTNWKELNAEERISLVSLYGGGEQAIEALKSLEDGEQISTLNILTSPQANSLMRKEFWEVASQGKLPLQTSSLGWILQRQDWSTNQILPHLARHLIETNPAEASQYMFHDSLKVRLHMSDLIDNTESLIDWLKLESDPLVRQHIRLNIQKNNSVSALVE